MKYLESIQFIYCYVFNFYKKHGDRYPGVMALLVISTIQIFNVITFFIIGLLFKIININEINKYYFPFFTFGFILMNYYYIYRIKERNFLLENYTNRERGILRAKKFTLLYVILSIVSFLICFIYYIFFLPS